MRDRAGVATFFRAGNPGHPCRRADPYHPLAEENERRVASGARPFARVIAPDYREIGG